MSVSLGNYDYGELPYGDSGTDVPVTAITVQAGSIIYVPTGTYPGPLPSPAVTDNQSSPYAGISSQGTTDYPDAVIADFLAVVASAGSLVVTGHKPSGSEMSLAAIEVRGANNLADHSNVEVSTTGGGAGGNVSTGSASLLISACFATGATPTSLTCDANWTRIIYYNAPDGNSVQFAVATRLVSSSGTYNCAWAIAPDQRLEIETVALNQISAGVSYKAIGAIAYSGTSTITPSYDALGTIDSAHDGIILLIGMKPSTANSGSVTTPTGFTPIGSLTGAGGYGTTLGADTGNTNIFAFSKDTVTGSESGTLSVTLSTNNVAWAVFVRVSKIGSGTFSIAYATGSDTSGGDVSITFESDPGVTINDLCLVAMCIPTDVTTPAQFTNEALSQTGVTFSNVVELGEPDSSTNNDIGGVIACATAAIGTSSAAPTFTATAGGTTTNVRGPAIFIRIREVASGTQYTQTCTANAVTTTTTRVASVHKGASVTSTLTSTISRSTGAIRAFLATGTSSLTKLVQAPKTLTTTGTTTVATPRKVVSTVAPIATFSMTTSRQVGKLEPAITTNTVVSTKAVQTAKLLLTSWTTTAIRTVNASRLATSTLTVVLDPHKNTSTTLQTLTSVATWATTRFSVVQHLLAATVVNTLVIAKSASKSISSTITTVMTEPRQVNKLASTTSTWVPSITTLKVKLQTLAVTVLATAAVARQSVAQRAALSTTTVTTQHAVGHSVAATTTATATRQTRVSRSVAMVSSWVATLNTQVVTNMRFVTASAVVGLATTLERVVSVGRAANAMVVTATAARRTAIANSMVATGLATMAKQVATSKGSTNTVATTLTTSLVHIVVQGMSATVTAAVSTSRMVGKFALAQVGISRQQLLMVSAKRDAVLDVVAQVSRGIPRSLTSQPLGVQMSITRRVGSWLGSVVAIVSGMTQQLIHAQMYPLHPGHEHKAGVGRAPIVHKARV